MLKKVLILFPKDWDRQRFSTLELREHYQFFFEGFDLFTFPQNARLITFDLYRYVDRLTNKYRRVGLDGVLSNNEQFGALTAALLAERLGLPGLKPRTVLIAQHKFYARENLGVVLPELNPEYCVIPYTVKSEREIALRFPFFVKPVKATYSVLARRVDSFGELREHLSFGPLETFIIKRLTKPFNDVLGATPGFPISADHLIAESLLSGTQVSVEGIVLDGKVRVLGLVDAIMYPGTQAFLRWDYPSRLPPASRERVIAASRRVVETLQYNHGFFNLEFVVDAETGDIKLIEINPRMAAQFSDLFDKVHALNLHRIALDLSCGATPDLEPRQGRNRVAASFVFRKFDGTGLHRPPTRGKLEWLARFDPDAHLMLYLKTGRSLAREMKWLGSHRYAVLNMGAESEAALREKHRRIKQELDFETGCDELPEAASAPHDAL
ncbi:MAG: ATP-grasp domain-containing protein [Usitatibacter sp.]